ncbi:MAG: TIGR01906 family membrane protein [Chloroflexi bacterium]|nr:TIGR01906 family membrane protein [Chloroflexota bacterium]
MPSQGPDLKSTEMARPSIGLNKLNRSNVSIAGAAVFALLLPVFLILFNVGYLTNSEWLYSYGWWRNDIANRTGLTVEELNSGADQIKEYFGNDAEFLDLRVNFGGTEVSLYKEREILHMVDVKALMQSVFSVTRWSGIALLVLLLAGAFTLKRDAASLLLRSLRWSAIGTGVFLVVFAATAAINFGWLFTQFHFLSFANDLWLLDPDRDYLIIMFPQRFFFEAAMFIGLLTIIDFAVVYGVARYAQKRLG